MMVLRFSFPRWLIFLVFLYGCEEESKTPEIEILKPNTNEVYSYGDTIIVVAEVAHAEPGIQVNVLDGNEVLEFGGRLDYESNGRYYYHLYYTNKYLPTKDYDLRVSAINQGERNSAFQTLKLNELPLQQNGLCFCSQNSMYFFDSAGTNSNLALTEPINVLAFSGIYGQVAGLGSNNSSIKFWDPKVPELVTEVSPENNTSFLDLTEYEGVFYALSENEGIRAFTENGMPYFNYFLPQNYQAEAMAVNRDGTVIIGKPIGQNLGQLYYYPKESSASTQFYQLGDHNYLICAWQENGFLLAEQAGTDTKLYLLDVENYTLDYFTTLFNETCVDLISDEGAGAYVSTTINLYHIQNEYDYIPNAIINFAPADMEVSKLDKSLYFSNGSVLQRWKNNQAQFVQSADSDINSFTIFYNK